MTNTLHPLTVWAPACGLTFEKADVETSAKILIGFEIDDGEGAARIFDGPGGALAKVTQQSHTPVL